MVVVELWDLDVPYKVQTNVNADGNDVIEICPNSMQNERDENYNIVLDYEKVQELIRVLFFVSNEIKQK